LRRCVSGKDDRSREERRSGTFNANDTDLNTDDESESGGYNGGSTGSENLSADDSTLATETANGNYTSASGSVSATGSSTNDDLHTDDGKQSESFPVGATGSHSDSSGYYDKDHGHATGPFSEAGGAITTEDQSYTDDDIASASGQQHDTQTSSPGAGVTVATDDQSSGSTSKSYHDSGDRDQTATGTTDSGSDNTLEHDTSSLTDKTTTTVTGGGSVEIDGGGDTADYTYTGSYDMANGSETDDGTFRQEDQPSSSGTISTDETFNDSDHSDFSDNSWQSFGGGYSAYGTTYDWTTVVTAADGGSATESDNGSIAAGVTSDNYNDKGNESETTSNSTSWDATTSSADGHGINTSSASGSTTSTETGGFTTPPAGTTIAPSGDNPAGYATSHETAGVSGTAVGQATMRQWGDANGGSYSGNYTGTASLSYQSSETQTIDAANNIDSKTATYSGEHSASEILTYHETGNITIPGFVKEQWTWDYSASNSEDTKVSGGDPGTETGTADSSGWASQTTSLAVTFWSSISQAWANGSTGSGSSGSSYTNGPTSGTTATGDPGPLGAGGNAPGAHGAVVMMPSFQLRDPKKYGGQGIPFEVGQGPTSVVGIVGGFQKNTDEKTETYKLTKGIAQKTGALNAKRFKMYQYDGVGTAPNKSIAEEQVGIMEAALRNGEMANGKTFSLILLGHSWGADKAMQTAAELDALLKKNPRLQGLYQQGKIQIHLVTIDPIQIGSATSAKPPKDLKTMVSSWHNYYQQDDLKTDAPGRFWGAPIQSIPYDYYGAADTKLTSDGKGDDINKHLKLPQIASQQILTDLGLLK